MNAPAARFESAHAVPAVEARPASDVSAITGVIGLAALFAWILVCRSWPALVDLFGLGGPREVMSGPNAALMGVVFSGGAMSAWAVLIEKVHRRPSTGIDWDNPRPLSAVVDVSLVKLVGLWTTFAIIGAFYCMGRWYWSGNYLFALEVIGWAALPIAVLAIPYVLWLDRRLIEPRDAAWHFGSMVLGRGSWDMEQVKKHGRAWFIKAFFTAFMVSIVPLGFRTIVEADIGAVLNNPVALGVLLFELLFVIDVQIGTVGYLMTFRPLDAHIRSGNPLLAGWVAALMCYPPIVWGIMGNDRPLGYEYNTGGWAWWFEGHEALLWVWMAWLVALTFAYAWATFAFGLRFSNLTYRGVITNGPYRFTRHPAYVSKNLFWWCTTLPFLVTNGSFTDAVRNTFFLGCVSAIYFWRAKTEEAHLLAEDEKYVAYHAWMARHGLITAPLERAKRVLVRRARGGGAPQPAE